MLRERTRLMQCISQLEDEISSNQRDFSLMLDNQAEQEREAREQLSNLEQTLEGQRITSEQYVNELNRANDQIDLINKELDDARKQRSKWNTVRFGTKLSKHIEDVKPPPPPL